MVEFLNNELSKEKVNGVDAPFGYGEVFSTGYLDTNDLIPAYRKYLANKNSYRLEEFDYEALSYNEYGVDYKDITAKNIVFAEGFGLLKNPFFEGLPLDGTKGELLLIRIPGLKINAMLKAGVFLIPIGHEMFKLGATYNWEDKTDRPTLEGKEELIEGLKSFMHLDFEIVEHIAGVRPTVKDRRPLLGRSMVSDRIFVLNGLGTRGVLLAPYLAEKLFEFIEENKELEDNLSIHRYKKFKIKK